jgi:hypothetical protein
VLDRLGDTHAAAGEPGAAAGLNARLEPRSRQGIVPISSWP